MSRAAIGSVILAAAFLAGCASEPRLAVQYDADADFGSYLSIGWSAEGTASGSVGGRSAHSLAKRIRHEVDRVLVLRGFQILTSPDHADLIARCNLIVASRQNVVYGGHPRNIVRYGEYDAQVYVYDEGVLVLEFIDPDSAEVVWRSTLTGDVSERVDDRRLTRAVEMALAGFPPGAD